MVDEDEDLDALRLAVFATLPSSKKSDNKDIRVVERSQLGSIKNDDVEDLEMLREVALLSRNRKVVEQRKRTIPSELNGDDLRYRLKRRSSSGSRNSSDQRNVIDINSERDLSEGEDIELSSPAEGSLNFDFEKPLLITVENKHLSKNIESYSVDNEAIKVDELDTNMIQSKNSVEPTFYEEVSDDDVNYDNLLGNSNSGSNDSTNSFEFVFDENTEEFDNEDWMDLLFDTDDVTGVNKDNTCALTSILDNEEQFGSSLSLGDVNDSNRVPNTSVECKSADDENDHISSSSSKTRTVGGLEEENKLECKLSNEENEYIRLSGSKKRTVGGLTEEITKKRIIKDNMLAIEKEQGLVEKEQGEALKRDDDDNFKKTDNSISEQNLSTLTHKSKEIIEEISNDKLFVKTSDEQKIVGQRSRKGSETGNLILKTVASFKTKKPTDSKKAKTETKGRSEVNSSNINQTKRGKVSKELNERGKVSKEFVERGKVSKELNERTIQKQVFSKSTKSTPRFESKQKEKPVSKELNKKMIQKDVTNEPMKIVTSCEIREREIDEKKLESKNETVDTETKLITKEKENIKPKEHRKYNKESTNDKKKKLTETNTKRLDKKDSTIEKVTKTVDHDKVKESTCKVGNSSKNKNKHDKRSRNKKSQNKKSNKRSPSHSSNESEKSACSTCGSPIRTRTSNSQSFSEQSPRSGSSSSSSSSSSSESEESDSSSSGEDNFKRRKRVETYRTNEMNNGRFKRGSYGNRREFFSNYSRDQRDRHYRPQNKDWQRRSKSPIAGRRNREGASDSYSNYRRGVNSAGDRRDRWVQGSIGIGRGAGSRTRSRSPTRSKPRRRPSPSRPDHKTRPPSRFRPESRRSTEKQTTDKLMRDCSNRDERKDSMREDKISNKDQSIENIIPAREILERMELMNKDLTLAPLSINKGTIEDKLLPVKSITTDSIVVDDTSKNNPFSTDITDQLVFSEKLSNSLENASKINPLSTDKLRENKSNSVEDREKLITNKLNTGIKKNTEIYNQQTDKSLSRRPIKNIIDLRQTLLDRTANLTKKVDAKADASEQKNVTEKTKGILNRKSSAVLIRDFRRKREVDTLNNIAVTDSSDIGRQLKGRVFTRLGRVIPAKSKSISINLKGSLDRVDFKKDVNDLVPGTDDLDLRIQRIRENNEAFLRRQKEIQEDIELHTTVWF